MQQTCSVYSMVFRGYNGRCEMLTEKTNVKHKLTYERHDLIHHYTTNSCDILSELSKS